MPHPSPSYARSTAASNARSSPKSDKVLSATTIDGSPRKLKRPSTLSGHERQLALLFATPQHGATGATIAPADPEKPCPFGSLPTEIREMIFEHLLPEVSITIVEPAMYNRSLWPALLRVSRRVRCEAAYVFYSRAEFEAHVTRLDFSHIRSWIENLPIEHRVFLGRNRALHIQIPFDDVRNGSFVTLNNWRSTRKFGDVYSIQGAQHRAHFISLCLLTEWWLWCAKPVYRDLKWEYFFFKPGRSVNRGRWRGGGFECALHFLKNELGTMVLPCTQGFKIDEKSKKLMGTEARNMLESLNANFPRIKRSRVNGKDWDERVALLRRFLAKW